MTHPTYYEYAILIDFPESLDLILRLNEEAQKGWEPILTPLVLQTGYLAYTLRRDRRFAGDAPEKKPTPQLRDRPRGWHPDDEKAG